jgi:Flp pilus assembly protein TadG
MIRQLLRNRSGATAAEFSLVLPMFMMFVMAFVGIGAVFSANAGLRHGVGEGARVATLFPRQNNAQIIAAMQNNALGLGDAIGTPTITPGTANGQDYVDITATVNPSINLFFIEVAPITLTETRRAYRAE